MSTSTFVPSNTDIMVFSVHTWMEPEADKLIMENISKNLSDQVRTLEYYMVQRMLMLIDC